MDYTYDELKAGMRELAVAQNKEFQTLKIHGERRVLSLEGREIAVILYPGKASSPVVFGCYGGGFIMGSAANNDACWAELREKLDVTLISINYRKAPDHPFPCALYDVYDCIAYVQTHPAEFGIASDDYSVCGFSAGGNLAAAVCLLDARRGNQLKLRRQILNYPYLDLASSPKVKGHPKSEWMMYSLFPEYYCADHNPSDTLISPIYAVEDQLCRLPRAIVCMAESDPLHAEGARYVAKLRAAGVPVDCQIAMDMPHGYLEMAFEQPGPYHTPKQLEQLKNGSIEKEKNKSFDFIKEHF